MAKYQSFLSRIGSNRDRAALRGIFSQFLTDDDPPALKDLVLASIVLSGAETTEITISGASTTGILQSGTSTTAYSITGAFTTGINIAADGTTAIAVTSAFSGVTGLSFAGTASGDGILVSGACADGIHISGTNTASGLHISGDQVDAILIDGDAAADNGIRILVDDGITIGCGINIDRTGTTGICTTGISIDTDGTTGLEIAAGFSGVNMISLAGTGSTSGITISGACGIPLNITGAFTTGITIAADGTTGISITSAFSGVNAISLAGTGSTAGINISGDHTTAITIGAQTTAGLAITGATATGISITGACATAALQIGASGTPAGDFIWYGTTALYKVLFDADGDTNGAVYFGVDTKGLLVSLYGDTTGCGVFWDPSTDTNGTLSIGASGGSKGNDLIAYGATNGNYMHWDQSANSLLLVGTSTVLNIAGTTASTTSATGALICAGGVGIGGNTFLGGTLTVGVDDTGYDVKFFGETASCYALYDASEDAFSIVQTNAATTGTERSFTVSQTHTGIGASAEVFSATLATETIGGTYQNAIYGKIDYGTTGSLTGLAGVVCAELSMPAGPIAGANGTYAAFEAEIDCPTGYTGIVPINVFSINAWGAAVAQFDSYGYLFDLTGVTSGAGNLWYDNQKAAPAVEEFIRVKTPAGVRYLALYNANA